MNKNPFIDVVRGVRNSDLSTARGSLPADKEDPENPFIEAVLGTSDPIVSKNELSETSLNLMRERDEDLLVNRGMGFGQNQARIPSILYPNSGYLTAPRTAEQLSRDKAASTEVLRNMQTFNVLGQGVVNDYNESLSDESDYFGLDTITTPIFDALGIYNHSIMGGIEEYLRSDSPYLAFRQAAIELSNSLTLADTFGVEDEVRRTTAADIFLGTRTGPSPLVGKQNEFLALLTSSICLFCSFISAETIFK